MKTPKLTEFQWFALKYVTYGGIKRERLAAARSRAYEKIRRGAKV